MYSGFFFMPFGATLPGSGNPHEPPFIEKFCKKEVQISDKLIHEFSHVWIFSHALSLKNLLFPYIPYMV
jgi:hypothetical protein